MAADSPRVLAVRDILTRSVRIGLGIPDATPRPGQALLADDMARAADPIGGHMAGLAPTGSGKSYASMSAAAVGAAKYGERWVIATEGLDLQQQYLRDSPHVAKAVHDAYGHDLKTAVLKGWSNYLCAQKTMNTVRQLGITNGAGGYDDTANRIDAAHLKDTVFADGRVHESKTLRPLLSWAVKQHQNPDVIGDKASYRGQMTDREWQAVSVSTQECVGENACPLAAICKPRISREKAAEADIVITNHAMLAVQAANNTPVVIGNTKLGPFHGIIVDEAQSLPASVRSQGTVTISAPRLHGIVNRVREAVGGPGNPSVDQWALDGREVIRYVESEIHSGVASVDDGRIPKDTDPLQNTGDVLTQWLKQGSQYIQSSTDQTDMASVIAGKRGSAAIDQMVQAVKDVRDHYVGVSRAWTESGDVSAIETAPVTVSGMLTRNIWNDSSGNGDEPPQDDTVKPPAGDDHQEAEVEPRPLTAICISGTLPKGFPRDAGLKTHITAYPSPFDKEYRNSLLVVARMDDPKVIDQVSVTAYGKQRFDVARHAEWVKHGSADAFVWNGGSGLMLAATARNGKLYAEHYRKIARGRFNVYSQWDGDGDVVKKWREDETSVLVGTKALMTGTDGPGKTNTLVQVDRVPRAASNPVDDARVEALMEAMSIDKWSADLYVYVADAASLLEQELGRLIRGGGDSGAAVVWDGRTINAGPFKYNARARNAYQEAMRWFPIKSTRLDDLKAYIKHGGHPA